MQGCTRSCKSADWPGERCATHMQRVGAQACTRPIAPRWKDSRRARARAGLACAPAAAMRAWTSGSFLSSPGAYPGISQYESSLVQCLDVCQGAYARAVDVLQHPDACACHAVAVHRGAAVAGAFRAPDAAYVLLVEDDLALDMNTGVRRPPGAPRRSGTCSAAGRGRALPPGRRVPARVRAPQRRLSPGATCTAACRRASSTRGARPASRASARLGGARVHGRPDAVCAAAPVPGTELAPQTATTPRGPTRRRKVRAVHARALRGVPRTYADAATGAARRAAGLFSDGTHCVPCAPTSVAAGACMRAPRAARADAALARAYRVRRNGPGRTALSTLREERDV